VYPYGFFLSEYCESESLLVYTRAFDVLPIVDYNLRKIATRVSSSVKQICIMKLVILFIFILVLSFSICWFSHEQSKKVKIVMKLFICK